MGVLVLLNAADRQISQYKMIAHYRIMYQPFNEGCVNLELIRVDDEFECRCETIYELLEWFLRMLDDLEKTIRTLWIVYLQCISLHEWS